VRRRWILGQVAQDLPAIHVWHHHVERNQIRAGFNGQPQCLWPTARMDDGIVMRRKVSLKQLVNGWVVVNHQHAGLASAWQAQGHMRPER